MPTKQLCRGLVMGPRLSYMKICFELTKEQTREYGNNLPRVMGIGIWPTDKQRLEALTHALYYEPDNNQQHNRTNEDS